MPQVEAYTRNMAIDKIYPGGGDTGSFHNLRKRLDIISRHLELQGKKIVDCGCGHGSYLLSFLSAGSNAYGIEYSTDKVVEFQTKYPQFANRILNGDLEKIGFETASFDIAFLNEVLEHVSDEKKALQEIHRVLQPGGALMVFSPNRFYPFEIHGVYLKANGRKIPHYFPFIPYIPVRVGRIFFNYWARNYWPYELRQKIVEANFRILSVGYVWQTFENISGNQPTWLNPLATTLRTFGNIAEKIPFLKVFGVSQYIVAAKS